MTFDKGIMAFLLFGTFAPGSESSRERKLAGAKLPRVSLPGANVPYWELSLPGAKVPKSEKAHFSVRYGACYQNDYVSAVNFYLAQHRKRGIVCSRQCL